MEQNSVKLVKDQMGREFLAPTNPKRIISLVPSQTELLYYFGLNQEIIGQTLFCIHPKHMHQIKPRVGGTKKLNLDKIRELKPDLIIGNKEENEQSQIEELMKEFPVWMSDITSLDEALQMINGIGDLLDKKLEASQLTDHIHTGFASLVRTKKSLNCVYLIWRDPWMAAGNNTFIHDLLLKLGLNNLVQTEKGRYPQLANDWFTQNQPELILLSSEPYPFKDKHLKELKSLCPNAQIMLVDGEMFSWYGSRLNLALPYFTELINHF